MYFFYVILINIKQYFFYIAKNTKSDIKIPGFRQNFQKSKKIEKSEKCFCAYDQVSQS